MILIFFTYLYVAIVALMAWIAIIFFVINGIILTGICKLEPVQIRIKNKNKYIGKESPIYKLNRHCSPFDFTEYSITKWELGYTNYKDPSILLLCLVPGIWQINRYGYHETKTFWLEDINDAKISSLEEPLNLEEIWNKMQKIEDSKLTAIKTAEDRIENLIKESNTKFTTNYIK